MNYKIKIKYGYRKDQESLIDVDEAHKAYFLFFNPEIRGVFNNGLAITGSSINEIVPDYVGSMGWNDGYSPTSEEWGEIKNSKMFRELENTLLVAKKIAKDGSPTDMHLPLNTVIAQKYPELKDFLNCKRSELLISLEDLNRKML